MTYKYCKYLPKTESNFERELLIRADGRLCGGKLRMLSSVPLSAAWCRQSSNSLRPARTQRPGCVARQSRLTHWCGRVGTGGLEHQPRMIEDRVRNDRSHGHARSQGSGLRVHGQFSGRWFGSKVWARFHDLMACCTRSSSHSVAACCGCTNIPRPAGGLRRPGPFFRSVVEASSHFGSATWIRQD